MDRVLSGVTSSSKNLTEKHKQVPEQPKAKIREEKEPLEIVECFLSDLEIAAVANDAKRTVILSEEALTLFRNYRQQVVECGLIQGILGVLGQFSNNERVVERCLRCLLQLHDFVQFGREKIPLCLLVRAHGVKICVDALLQQINHSRSQKSVRKFLFIGVILLRNIASVELGTRMLISADAHRFLLEPFTSLKGLLKDSGTEREIWYHTIGTLSIMAMYQLNGRSIFHNILSMRSDGGSETRMTLNDNNDNIVAMMLDAVMNGIPPADLSFHIDFCRLLCFVSAGPEGAKTILDCKMSIMYVKNILRCATFGSEKTSPKNTSAKQNALSRSESGSAPKAETDDGLITKKDRTSEVPQQTSDNDSREKSTTSTPKSQLQMPTAIGSEKETLQASINQSLNKGLGLGASIFNKLTRKPSLSKDGSDSDSKQDNDEDALIDQMKRMRTDSYNKSKEENSRNNTEQIGKSKPWTGQAQTPEPEGGSCPPESIRQEPLSNDNTDGTGESAIKENITHVFDDSSRAGAWAAMLLHNLCLASRFDVDKRKQIAEEYEKNLNFSSTSHYEIYFDILERIVAICSVSEAEIQRMNNKPLLSQLPHGDKEGALDLPGLVVEYIAKGKLPLCLSSLKGNTNGGDIEGDMTGRVILFNLAHLEHRYGIKLEDILAGIVKWMDNEISRKPWLSQAFGREPFAESLPKPLPVSRELTRLLTFIYMLAGHPSLRNRLINSENSVKTITKFNRYTLEGDGASGAVKNLTLRKLLMKGKTFAPEYFSTHYDTLWALLDIQHDGNDNDLIDLDSNSRTVLKPTKLLGYRHFPSATKISHLHVGKKNGEEEHLKSPSKRNSINISAAAASSFSGMSPLEKTKTPYVTSHSNSVLSPLLSSRSLNGAHIADDKAETIENSSVKDVMANDLSLSDGSTNRFALLNHDPKAFAEQLSLYQQKLYLAIDPCLWLLCANEIESLIYFRYDDDGSRSSDKFGLQDTSSSSIETTTEMDTTYRHHRRRFRRHINGNPASRDAVYPVKRFLDEYYKLAYFLKDSIIKGRTPQIRAERISYIIDVAEYAADESLNNASLTMACLEVLGSMPIRRLELTWRNVDREKWKIFESLMLLCAYEESVVLPHLDSQSGLNESGMMPEIDISISSPSKFSQSYEQRLTPTLFFQSSRVPYVQGILRALHNVSFSWVSSSMSRSQSLEVNSSSQNNDNMQAGDQKHASSSSSGAHAEESAHDNEDKDSPFDENTNNTKGAVEDDYTSKGLASLAKVRSFNVSSINMSRSISSLSELTHSPSGTMAFDPLGLFDKANSEFESKRTTSSPQSEMETDASKLDPFFMDSIGKLDADAFALMREQYRMLNEWIPTIGANGDWYPKMFVIQPDPNFHMLLKRLDSPDVHIELRLQRLSYQQEPIWSLEQMLLESMYAVEGLVENLFQSDTEKEGAMIKHIRTLSLSSESSTRQPKTRNIASLAQSIMPGNDQSSLQKDLKANIQNPKAPKKQLLSPKYVGKIINSIVKEISTTRRDQLLEESGVRSADQWEKIVDHVRLCVERVVLAPILSRLMLSVLRDTTEQECALQEKIGILKEESNERLAHLLGIPKRKKLDECCWHGAVATLKTFDVVSMPSLKLGVLLGVKDEIFREAGDLGVDDMNADDFLPIMTYIVCRAGLRHPWSTVTILRQILGDDFVSGEAAYYLTTFEIALNHLLHLDMTNFIKAT